MPETINVPVYYYKDEWTGECIVDTDSMREAFETGLERLVALA